MAAASSTSSISLDESGFIKSLQGNNIDSEDDFDDNYINDILGYSGDDEEEVRDLFANLWQLVDNSSVSDPASDTVAYKEDDTICSKKRKKTLPKTGKKKARAADTVPPGFETNLWKDDDHPLEPLQPFDTSVTGLQF